jgi:hypothetical protein
VTPGLPRNAGLSLKATIMGRTGRGTFGLERMLLALKGRGLAPDKSGMFIVDRHDPLTSLDVETLGRVCDMGGYDWKYTEDAAQ